MYINRIVHVKYLPYLKKKRKKLKTTRWALTSHTPPLPTNFLTVQQRLRSTLSATRLEDNKRTLEGRA